MGFMTKDAQVRVDEVVAAVVARFPAGEQAAAKSYIDAWLTRATGSSQAALKILSEEMTMTDVKNAGDKVARAKRRALMLLESIKGTMNPKQTVSGIAIAVVDTRIAALVDKLRFEVSGATGDGSVIRDAFLNGIKATPTNFLQANRLLSGGIAAGTEAYFFYEYKKDQFRIEPKQPGDQPHAYKFTTVSVPAVSWNDVPGRGDQHNTGSFATIDGVHLTGADVMISTQFSGCCFCFKIVAGELYAAHIMPDDQKGHAITGALLAQQIAGAGAPVTAGNFTGTGAGGLTAYGAGWSNLGAPLNGGYPVRTTRDQFMNIFASRIAGHWQIYSQEVNGLALTVNRLH